jgi:hypothetical protein
MPSPLLCFAQTRRKKTKKTRNKNTQKNIQEKVQDKGKITPLRRKTAPFVRRGVDPGKI